MPEHLSIQDDALEAAGVFLVVASDDLAGVARSIPPPLESLTGIGGDVQHFLRGLQTGRFALADAAKTASGQISGVMRDSTELDASIAQRLYTGFAVAGSGR